MRETIHAALKPVRNRLQIQFALRCAFVGLIAGGIAALAVGAARQAFAPDLSWLVGAGLLAAGPFAGGCVGLLLRRDWHAAAAVVDAHYGLKDRAVTALAFADANAASDLQVVQMHDALNHLGTVEPKAVVPLGAPRSWRPALAATAAAIAVLAWPLALPDAQAGPAPVPEHIAAVAADQQQKIALATKALSETIQDIDDDQAKEDQKAAQELKDKLAKKTEEVTQDGTDEKEALAKLSEMMAAWQAFANELNVAALEGQMSSLGTALAASQAFEGAGKALMEGKLEKAAKELEKLDEVKLTPKEEKALEEKLKQLAKQMGDAGQGSLGDAVSELADSLKGGKGKIGNASRKLAKKINNAVKRRKAADLAFAQIEELKDAKCQCQNNGGARIKQPSKSNSPSSNWGRAISGNTDGERTKLGGKRNEVQVSGTPGAEGDSEIETTATPEARERASREYKERYEKFKKASETVIDAEPIPLGFRQMVKRYFETIRPSGTDPVEKK
ncbi:MAG TPA: hypothetical protein VN641_22725 [Urbifossiella sp.]|nr:hypothetical protein [Urbifossiella sp.]